MGFTLIEVMVALAIFALLSTACYQFLDSLSQSRAALLSASEQRSRLEKARLIIEQDLRHALPRSVRETDQQQRLPAIIGGDMLALSRGGLPLSDSLFRAGPGRVIYRIEDVDGEPALVRLVYRVLDRAAEGGGDRQTLVRGVSGMRQRFMTETGGWVSTWPASRPSSDMDRLNQLPLAVELVLVLADNSEHKQIISLR